MNERGSLLITGLWAMSVFSVMTISLSFSASQELMLAKRDLGDFKSHLDFLSAMNQVAWKMDTDPFPHEDSPAKPWFGDVQLEKPFEGRLSVSVEDENSKINLNYASEALVSTFLRAFEKDTQSLKGSHKDYVKGISKMRSKKRFQSLEELLLMEDFEKEDLEAMRPYMTVYSENAFVNINTAKPLVLRVLLDSLSTDHGAKHILFSRLEEACNLDKEKLKETEQGCFFLSRELQPETFAERLKLPRTPVMLNLVQQFLSLVTTDSEIFCISMKADQREALGIFRYRVGQARPRILWWHEE